MTTANTNSDPISFENRELMDYLYEHKDQMSSEVYIQLSELVAKKEKAKSNFQQKFFKVKYILNEVVSFARNSYLECCEERNIELNTMFNTKTYVKVLRSVQITETENNPFDDIMNGVIQLDVTLGGYLTNIHTGDTYVKSVALSGGYDNWDEDIAGKKSSTLHILFIEECDLQNEEAN
ncbi:MAG: hypothetical protein Ct9H90mP28_3460 [Paracoccaceae bacterium]|nr:MAG: hypothetical protein Ct9H90mP28_3460 [Paracoccaceae bacterium]